MYMYKITFELERLNSLCPGLLLLSIWNCAKRCRREPSSPINVLNWSQNIFLIIQNMIQGINNDFAKRSKEISQA